MGNSYFKKPSAKSAIDAVLSGDLDSLMQTQYEKYDMFLTSWRCQSKDVYIYLRNICTSECKISETFAKFNAQYGDDYLSLCCAQCSFEVFLCLVNDGYVDPKVALKVSKFYHRQ